MKVNPKRSHCREMNKDCVLHGYGESCTLCKLDTMGTFNAPRASGTAIYAISEAAVAREDDKHGVLEITVPLPRSRRRPLR